MKFPKFRLPKINVTVCDNCGKPFAKVFPGSRVTKCCSTYDPEDPKAFYTAVDEAGITVRGIGKAYKALLQLPFHFGWRGFIRY